PPAGTRTAPPSAATAPAAPPPDPAPPPPGSAPAAAPPATPPAARAPRPAPPPDAPAPAHPIRASTAVTAARDAGRPTSRAPPPRPIRLNAHYRPQHGHSRRCRRHRRRPTRDATDHRLPTPPRESTRGQARSPRRHRCIERTAEPDPRRGVLRRTPRLPRHA